MATIDSHYFRVCTRGAVRSGLSLPRLLAEAGVDATSIATPGWRGDVRAMALLVQAIWRDMADEAMGFTEHGFPVGSFAFASELAWAGETVGEGLARAIRFYNLICPDIETTLTILDREATVRVRFRKPALDPDHYLQEFWLIIWHRLASWLASETVPLLATTFNYTKPIEYFEEFRHLFPCPHQFEADETSIIMDARTLAAPVRRREQELIEMIRVAPLDIMTIPASDHSLARRVRLLLQRNYAISADEIAEALSLSGEVLRKRLRREGTALSMQRQEVRRDAAMRALSRGGRSIEAIAFELGYEETRSFTRAFKAWTGVSPSRFRQLMLSPAGLCCTNWSLGDPRRESGMIAGVDEQAGSTEIQDQELAGL